ncbi:hypothetical protein [Streptomyces sp. NPDC048527]|uniref:IS1634 family transposase n=1 Tax=Streptomyces sp. NPDC048527 TaxID=3365568 RepID=UPI00371D5696
MRDNLQVKEVNIGTDDRFVICFNPDQATRDAAIRERMVAQLTEVIEGTDKLPRPERDKLAGVLSTKPGLKRFLRATPGGLLRVDKKKIAAEANLDGKYLLRSSDPKLSAEDIALGYKQLLEVERGWRDMKQILDLRPVYHRREDRIRAHVLLCWLALLLIRVAEYRPYLEPPAHRAPAPARRHLHRPGRHLPSVHRPHQVPARHLHRPRRRPTQEDHRSERRPLTRHYPTA